MNCESSSRLGLAVGASAVTRLDPTSTAFIQVVQRPCVPIVCIFSQRPAFFNLGTRSLQNSQHVNAGSSLCPRLCMAKQSME